MNFLQAARHKGGPMDRRRDSIVPLLGGLLAVLVSINGAGIISAIHDVTDELRNLSKKVSVIEANQLDDRHWRDEDEARLKTLEDHDSEKDIAIHDLQIKTRNLR
jgi:hypothetical protein